MPGYRLVDGYLRAERSQALARLAHAAHAAGGTLVDFAVFGDRAVRASVELPVRSLLALRDALEAEDVRLFPHSRAGLTRGGASRSPTLAMIHLALVGDLDEEASAEDPEAHTIAVP